MARCESGRRCRSTTWHSYRRADSPSVGDPGEELMRHPNNSATCRFVVVAGWFLRQGSGAGARGLESGRRSGCPVLRVQGDRILDDRAAQNNQRQAGPEQLLVSVPVDDLGEREVAKSAPHSDGQTDDDRVGPGLKGGQAACWADRVSVGAPASHGTATVNRVCPPRVGASDAALPPPARAIRGTSVDYSPGRRRTSNAAAGRFRCSGEPIRPTRRMARSAADGAALRGCFGSKAWGSRSGGVRDAWWTRPRDGLCRV